MQQQSRSHAVRGSASIQNFDIFLPFYPLLAKCVCRQCTSNTNRRVARRLEGRVCLLSYEYDRRSANHLQGPCQDVKARAPAQWAARRRCVRGKVPMHPTQVAAQQKGLQKPSASSKLLASRQKGSTAQSPASQARAGSRRRYGSSHHIHGRHNWEPAHVED